MIPNVTVTTVQLLLLRLIPPPHQKLVLLTSETGANATGIMFLNHAGKATSVEFITLLLKAQSFGCGRNCKSHLSRTQTLFPSFPSNKIAEVSLGPI